jgi:hypothetical protein
VAFLRGDLERAVTFVERVSEDPVVNGRPVQLAALLVLGTILLERGDRVRAEALFTACQGLMEVANWRYVVGRLFKARALLAEQSGDHAEPTGCSYSP